MFVELHILQNFAPANLNRDDTGSPKDCEFGGFRRARISSQCLKRAVRTTFESRIPREERAVRTKRLAMKAAELLAERGHAAEDAHRVVTNALGGVGIATDTKTRKTEYLLFLGSEATKQLADLCHNHWDALAAVPSKASEPEGGNRLKQSRKAAKKEAKDTIKEDLQSRIKDVLRGPRAVDLALFGRMIADLTDMNVDAACQVAHAISTHRISMEFDYYTAVDDLAPQEEPGADMLGTVEFNSACFYRYANVDLGQLTRNLHNDRELAEQALVAFLQGSVLAVPTGKQTSSAAQNPPSLVTAVVREHGLWSLANAFLRPVRPREEKSLAVLSIEALDRYWGRLVAAYGDDSLRHIGTLALEPDVSLEHLKPSEVPSLKELLDGVGRVVRQAPHVLVP
jgi:CRISPR system Cascade subunit CasC